MKCDWPAPGDAGHHHGRDAAPSPGMVDPAFWNPEAMGWEGRPAGLSKLDWLEALARRAEGITALEASWALGWRPASVRGAISAALRRQRRLPVQALRSLGGCVYHIAPAALSEV